MNLMRKHLTLLSVTAALLLGGNGWWASKTSSGENTDIINGYLPIAAVALALELVAGAALTSASRPPLRALR
jgi:hypothetical protein